MPISRIFNGLYNLYSQAPTPVQTEAEKLAKNIVHTWNLADGDKAYLIRDNGKLNCLFVRGDDGIMVPILIPDSVLLEEVIGRLLEMRPVLINDSTIDFIENEVEELHTWNVKYGNSVTLIRIGEKLKYRTPWGENQIQGNVAPDGLSLEKQIEWAQERYPHVYSVNKEMCHVIFEEKIKEQKSAIDRKISLDINHWSVTFFNIENSIFSGFKSYGWMGHAVLIIETIEEGGYFARKADLIKEKDKAYIRFFEITRNSAGKYGRSKPKTETYGRLRTDIQKIIDQIWLEVKSQENGNPLLSYKIDSGKMKNLAKMINLQHIMNLPAPSDDLLFENLKRLKEEKYENCCKDFSCGEWGAGLLSLANIRVPLQTGSLLSKMFFPTPVLYAGSKIKAIVQETSLVTSYVALYSLPFMPAILSALARGNYRGLNQMIAITAGWALTDVINAYSVHYFQGTRLGYWLDYKDVNSKKQSEYKWQEHEENTSLLDWFVNDFVGDFHEKSFKEIILTKESLYKILKMIAVQKALRS